MDILAAIATTVLDQLQKPTLAFLIAGMMLAALGSKFEIPEPVYKFIVILLLLKVGIGAGISIREADFISLLVPAIGATAAGIGIVVMGSFTLARMNGVSEVDAMATVGLFGAVSASTLAATMAMLDDNGIAYEGFIGALYPFMDIAALVTAIAMAKVSAARKAVTQNGDTLTAGGPSFTKTLTNMATPPKPKTRKTPPACCAALWSTPSAAPPFPLFSPASLLASCPTPIPSTPAFMSPSFAAFFPY